MPFCARKCQLRLSQSDDRLGGAGSSIMRGHEAQRRKHRSPTCPATCWRVRPSVVLVDAPARQRCAAHAPATEAAAARSRRRGAIKREKKGATSASCHSLILEIGSSSVPLSTAQVMQMRILLRAPVRGPRPAFSLRCRPKACILYAFASKCRPEACTGI